MRGILPSRSDIPTAFLSGATTAVLLVLDAGALMARRWPRRGFSVGVRPERAPGAARLGRPPPSCASLLWFLPSPPGCLVLPAPVRSTAARIDGTLDPCTISPDARDHRRVRTAGGIQALRNFRPVGTLPVIRRAEGPVDGARSGSCGAFGPEPAAHGAEAGVTAALRCRICCTGDRCRVRCGSCARSTWTCCRRAMPAARRGRTSRRGWLPTTRRAPAGLVWDTATEYAGGAHSGSRCGKTAVGLRTVAPEYEQPGGS